MPDRDSNYERSDAALRLTSGRLLSVNVAWNLVGFAAPIVVAIAAIPLLVHGLGTERFGILSLAWVLIGSFSLFDLGLGRALTQVVASMLGRGDVDKVGAVAQTGLLLMVLCGAAAAFLLVLGSPWLVTSWLHIPTWLNSEAEGSIRLLALGLPVVMASAGLRGILEAQQHFGLSNLVRIPLGVLTYGGPPLVLPFSNSLIVVSAVLLTLRIVAAVAYLALCLWTTPRLRQWSGLAWSQTVSILRLGAWISVSNFISPLMAYADRFFIGAVLSVAAVAYYSVPYDVLTRFLVLPAAIAAVMFPAFATSFVDDRKRTATLFVQGSKYIFLFMFPITVVSVTLGGEGLRQWLGEEFAQHDKTVVQLLAAGVLFNGLAQMPFALIQGTGRADLAAKLHLIEAPAYVILLWSLISTAGINGAALAWTLRVLADMLALYVLGFRLVRLPARTYARMALLLIAAVAVLTASSIPSGLVSKTLFLLPTLVAFFVATWVYILSLDERQLAMRLLIRNVKTTT